MARAAISPKVSKERQLAEELVDINRRLRAQHEADFKRIDELKELLKDLATKAGASVSELFPGKGKVSASGDKESEFVGDLPEVDGAVWTALAPAKRDKLVATGIVKIVPTWSRKYSGRVTVKLF